MEKKAKKGHSILKRKTASKDEFAYPEIKIVTVEPKDIQPDTSGESYTDKKTVEEFNFLKEKAQSAGFLKKFLVFFQGIRGKIAKGYPNEKTKESFDKNISNKDVLREGETSAVFLKSEGPSPAFVEMERILKSAQKISEHLSGCRIDKKSDGKIIQIVPDLSREIENWNSKIVSSIEKAYEAQILEIEEDLQILTPEKNQRIGFIEGEKFSALQRQAEEFVIKKSSIMENYELDLNALRSLSRVNDGFDEEISDILASDMEQSAKEKNIAKINLRRKSVLKMEIQKNAIASHFRRGMSLGNMERQIAMEKIGIEDTKTHKMLEELNDLPYILGGCQIIEADDGRIMQITPETAYPLSGKAMRLLTRIASDYHLAIENLEKKGNQGPDYEGNFKEIFGGTRQKFKAQIEKNTTEAIRAGQTV